MEPSTDTQNDPDTQPHNPFGLAYAEQMLTPGSTIPEAEPDFILDDSDEPAVRYVRRRASRTEDDRERPRLSLFRRTMFVVVTLLLIFAILAMTILPGLLAAERNYYLRQLPPPTILPRT